MVTNSSAIADIARVCGHYTPFEVIQDHRFLLLLLVPFPSMDTSRILSRGGQIRGLGRKSPSGVQGWSPSGGQAPTSQRQICGCYVSIIRLPSVLQCTKHFTTIIKEASAPPLALPAGAHLSKLSRSIDHIFAFDRGTSH